MNWHRFRSRVCSDDDVISRTRSRVVSRDSAGNANSALAGQRHKAAAVGWSTASTLLRACLHQISSRRRGAARLHETSSVGFAGNYRHGTARRRSADGKHAKSPCRPRLTAGIRLSGRARRDVRGQRM